MGYGYSFYMLLNLEKVISTQNHCKAFYLHSIGNGDRTSGMITVILLGICMIFLVLILSKLQGFPYMQRSPPLFEMIPGLGLLDSCLLFFLIPTKFIQLNEFSLLPMSTKPQQPGMQWEFIGLLYIAISWSGSLRLCLITDFNLMGWTIILNPNPLGLIVQWDWIDNTNPMGFQILHFGEIGSLNGLLVQNLIFILEHS